MSQKSKPKFHLQHVTLSQLEASVTRLVLRSPVVGHSVNTWLDPSCWAMPASDLPEGVMFFHIHLSIF